MLHCYVGDTLVSPTRGSQRGLGEGDGSRQRRMNERREFETNVHRRLDARGKKGRWLETLGERTEEMGGRKRVF